VAVGDGERERVPPEGKAEALGVSEPARLAVSEPLTLGEGLSLGETVHDAEPAGERDGEREPATEALNETDPVGEPEPLGERDEAAERDAVPLKPSSPPVVSVAGIDLVGSGHLLALVDCDADMVALGEREAAGEAVGEREGSTESESDGEPLGERLAVGELEPRADPELRAVALPLGEFDGVRDGVDETHGETESDGVGELVVERRGERDGDVLPLGEPLWLGLAAREYEFESVREPVKSPDMVPVRESDLVVDALSEVELDCDADVVPVALRVDDADAHGLCVLVTVTEYEGVAAGEPVGERERDGDAELDGEPKYVAVTDGEREPPCERDVVADRLDEPLSELLCVLVRDARCENDEDAEGDHVRELAGEALGERLRDGLAVSDGDAVPVTVTDGERESRPLPLGDMLVDGDRVGRGELDAHDALAHGELEREPDGERVTSAERDGLPESDGEGLALVDALDVRVKGSETLSVGKAVLVDERVEDELGRALLVPVDDTLVERETAGDCVPEPDMLGDGDIVYVWHCESERDAGAEPVGVRVGTTVAELHADAFGERVGETDPERDAMSGPSDADAAGLALTACVTVCVPLALFDALADVLAVPAAESVAEPGADGDCVPAPLALAHAEPETVAVANAVGSVAEGLAEPDGEAAPLPLGETEAEPDKDAVCDPRGVGVAHDVSVGAPEAEAHALAAPDAEYEPLAEPQTEAAPVAVVEPDAAPVSVGDHVVDGV